MKKIILLFIICLKSVFLFSQQCIEISHYGDEDASVRTVYIYLNKHLSNVVDTSTPLARYISKAVFVKKKSYNKLIRFIDNYLHYSKEKKMGESSFSIFKMNNNEKTAYYLSSKEVSLVFFIDFRNFIRQRDKQLYGKIALDLDSYIELCGGKVEKPH